MRFSGKVALVTGGARGIGFAIAKRLCREGASIAIADKDRQAGANACANIEQGGGRAISVTCDVADPISMSAAGQETESVLGGIDMLVANAGLHLDRYVRPVSELPIEAWRKLLDVNVLGIINSANACRDAMRKRGGGAIVTISSMASYKGENAYGISKLAVRGLTVALARDLAADGIRVCGVAPGLVGSEEVLARFPAQRRDRYVNEIQLVRRLGEVDDVAAAAAFLLSDEASFITAETILVTGGAYVRI